MSERSVICGDSFIELPKLQQHAALITSLPDADELSMSLAEYDVWLHAAARLCFDAVPPDGVCIFYQTDRKGEGRWYSKSAVLIESGHRLLWHKIVLRNRPGAIDLYRPGYTHLLAFSERGKVGATTADVISAGRYLWPLGMGGHAALVAAEYAARFGSSLVDPFCGRGTVLAVADGLFDRITGIDIDETCCEQARRVRAA